MANSAFPPPSNESPSASPRRDLHLRVHHVTLYVRDQDRSLRFYVDQLGFSLVADYRFGEHGRFVVVAPPDGTALLALVAPRPDKEEHKLIGHSGHTVLVTEDVQAKFDEWCRNGVSFRGAPRQENWGGTTVSFEDPDGNSFSLVGWDELTRDIEAQRRTIADKLEAERRVAQELEIARQVQARLFPQTTPPLSGMDYTGICIPAREVGGDYYDFLSLGSECLAFVVADISGKGIGAALLMANLQANLRSQCVMASDEPQSFLQSVNELLYRNTTTSAYATLFFGEYAEQARRLRYANCGHVPGFVLRSDGRIEQLDSTGTVVGLFAEWECSLREVPLLPGDVLVLYTDGITESFNDAGEEFGEERLVEALRRYRDLPSEALVTAILQEVRQFSGREQHDDMTLIVAKCRENPGDRAPSLPTPELH